ncbi:hypothetical protein [Pleionea sediminis]|uniref:hypothetical protein n=1 Tax=Pleionea sediminis TaxID=2569479 RepID=UPI0011857943|nr:hypothetical protein [Pleionea sediminis]
MTLDNNKLELTLKAWEKTVDVQMHFNDLCLKVRSFAMSILGVMLGGAAISYRYGGDVVMSSLSFPIAAIFISVSIIIWAAFYLMDRYWYHELLRGAVIHGRKLEKVLNKNIPEIALANSIRKTSHASLSLNAAKKLDCFYIFILLVQICALIAVSQGSVEISN